MRFSFLVVGGLALSSCMAEQAQSEDVEVTSEAALRDIANGLNGQMLLAPCLNDTQFAVCQTHVGACPPANPTDPALSGVLLTDKTVTLGGLQNQSYTIHLHIQGEVESKQYGGGVDQNSTLFSPHADGFITGGVPTPASAYDVKMIRVTNPGSSTHTDYFLNSLQGPGVSNHTTYGMDYTAAIHAKGGATIRLVSSDPNCSQIKNCGPTVNDGNSCLMPIVLSNIDPVARAHNPTFNFNTAYNGQWIAIVVTDVTTP